MPRGNFKQVEEKLLRGERISPETGWINPAIGAGSSGASRNLRGVESNTARGIKESPVITGITPVEYAPATDAPPVDPYDTYEDEM